MNVIKKYLVLLEIFSLYIAFSIASSRTSTEKTYRENVQPIEKWFKGGHTSNSDLTKSLENSLKYIHKMCRKEITVSCANDISFIYVAYFELKSKQLATSRAKKQFDKLNKILPYEEAFRGFLNSPNTVADTTNKTSDLEFKTKLVLRTASVLKKNKSSDSPINKQLLSHVMNFVVTVFAQNRIDFKNIKEDFEEFMKTCNITTELENAIASLSLSFYKLQEESTFIHNPKTKKIDRAYRIPNEEDIVLAITGFSMIGKREVPPNYTRYLTSTEKITKLLRLILNTYILYGMNMNQGRLESFSNFLITYEHHENSLHTKLNLFDSAILLKRFGIRIVRKSSNWDASKSYKSFERKLGILFLKAHFKMDSINEIMTSKSYKDYRLALNDLRHAMNVMQRSFGDRKISIDIQKSLLTKANRKYLDNELEILAKIASQAVPDIHWHLKKIHSVLMEMNKQDITLIDYFHVMKYYLLLTIPQYAGSKEDSKIMNVLRDEIIQRWPDFNKLLLEGVKIANKANDEVYNVIFHPDQISLYKKQLQWTIFENALKSQKDSVERHILIFLLAHIYPTEIRDLIKRKILRGSMVKNMEVVLKAVSLCPNSRALSNELVGEIADFYTEFFVHHHGNLDTDLDTDKIDKLFEKFSVENQHVFVSVRLPRLSPWDITKLCRSLMDRIEKNLKQSSKNLKKINSVIFKMVLMIRNRRESRLMTQDEMMRIIKIFIQLLEIDNAFDWNDKSFDLIFQYAFDIFKEYARSAFKDEQIIKKIMKVGGDASRCAFVNFQQKIYLLYLMSLNSRSDTGYKRIATEKDIENILKLRQTILKQKKSLDSVILKSQQTFFEVYPVGIGNVVSKSGVNYTIYSDVMPVAGFTNEMAQWMLNSIAYQDRDGNYFEESSVTKITISLLQTIYSSTLNEQSKKMFSEISKKSGNHASLQTSMRAIRDAGNFINSKEEYYQRKQGGAEKPLNSYIVEFDRQFK